MWRPRELVPLYKEIQRMFQAGQAGRGLRVMVVSGRISSWFAERRLLG
ncbi:MAG: hypothetical protein ACKO0N_07120 [Planctomycetota bacterium]